MVFVAFLTHEAFFFIGNDFLAWLGRNFWSSIPGVASV